VDAKLGEYDIFIYYFLSVIYELTRYMMELQGSACSASSIIVVRM